MSDPDDTRFRPDDATPDDYDVGEDYAAAPAPGEGAGAPVDLGKSPSTSSTAVIPAGSPPRPGERPGMPYGAVEPGLPLPGGTGWQGNPPPPSGGAPSGRKRQPASRRTTLLVALGVLTLVLVSSYLGSRLGDDSDADAQPTSTVPPDVDTSWIVTMEDLDPAAADDVEIAIGIDGAFTGLSLVTDPAAFVVGYGVDHEPDALAGIDPVDGAILWTRDLPSGLCGDQAFDGALACLAHEDGGWVYHRIDIVTGEDLAVVPAPVRDAMTVHAGPDALVVVGSANPAPHADLTAIGLDGELLWKVDLATVDGAEYLFDDLLASDFGSAGAADVTMERPRWRDLDEGLMMLWSTPGVAIIDPTAGTVVVHECLRATPAHDRYFCQDDAGINRRDLTGEVVWSLPDLELAYVADTSDARPVAVSEVFEVIPLDWETGEVTGPAIHRFDPQPGGFTGTTMGPSAVGDAQTQYLEQDGEILVRLADDVDEVQWVYEAGEDVSYVESAFTFGDVSVVDTYTLVGLDGSTGEELWRRYNPYGIYNSPFEESLIAIGFDEVARLELP